MNKALLAVLAVVSVAFPTASKAHHSVTGWLYPFACCSGKDCHEIRSTAVVEGPNGYTITLRKDEHQMLIRDTTFQVAYGDIKIKDSPDGLYHLCVTQQHIISETNMEAGGAVLCVFIPPRGS